MEVLNLIDEMEDIIENSSQIPFSGKSILDKEELLEIIKEIRLKLPDEIKQANWIKEEKKRILAEAQKEANTLMDEAKIHLEELVERDEITKAAKERAEEILSKAQSNAKDIRIGAMEYAEDLIMVLEQNRKELSGPK